MRFEQASTETQVPRFPYNIHYNVDNEGDKKRAVSGSLNWAAGQALVTCAVSTQGEPCNLTLPRASPTLPSL